MQTKKAENPDLSKAVSIGNGTWWVGSGGKSFLSRNSYFREFKGSEKVVNLLIDPGPPLDFDQLNQKVTSIVGGLGKVNMIFANHQDPDVVGCLPYLAKINPNAYFLASEDTWRLVRLFGLNSKYFRAVERFKDGRAVLPSGHQIHFIATPFCHFRGAVMLYDPDTRILFSGDLLGGIASPGLFAGIDNWIGIKAFHQLYMPSNAALRLAVQKIRQLDPAPVMIAPQHGGILEGELIETFLERLENLQVGLDIITSLHDQLPLLLDAVNEILDAGRQLLGEDRVAEIMRAFEVDGTYPAFFTLTRSGRVQEIRGEPFETIETMVKILYRSLDERQKNLLTARILKILLDRNLPPFDLLLQQEAGPEFELSEAEF